MRARADAHKVGMDFDIEIQGVAELSDHPVVRADETLQSRSLASKCLVLCCRAPRAQAHDWQIVLHDSSLMMRLQLGQPAKSLLGLLA